jgi:DNA invertase Pin-like site-specific DNA recombinase
MKAALYARVSTDMQNEGYSIDAQKELLKKYCEIKQIEEYD